MNQSLISQEGVLIPELAKVHLDGVLEAIIEGVGDKGMPDGDLFDPGGR